MPVIQSSYFLREIRPAFRSDLSLSMSRSILCVLMATLADDEVPEVCERVAILHGLSSAIPSSRSIRSQSTCAQLATQAGSAGGSRSGSSSGSFVASAARPLSSGRLRRGFRRSSEGDRRGHSPPPEPLPGTREAWPQRVGWLWSAKPTRPPTLGNLGRQLRWSYFVGQSEGDLKVDSDGLQSPRGPA